MSQDEIVDWLRKNAGWHPAKDMIVAGASEQAVYSGCRLMRKNKKVEYKAGDHGIWLYRAKADGR